MTQTRRRFLAISAAALAVPMGAQAAPVAHWRGRALGADASIALAGVSQIEARPLLARLAKELDRLEGIFSLYRPDSALARLNRTGRLDQAPPQFLSVLGHCEAIHHASGGVFDPTIQPLWQAMARGEDTARARALVGWSGVQVSDGTVSFKRPGMAMTLNGIAQGEITDHIAGWLAARGFSDVLVNTGEIAARGRRAQGDAWRAGIAVSDGRILRRLELSNRALATSEPSIGTGVAHILDPRGGSASQSLVSVSAPRAVLADGLSTACCLMPQVQAHGLVSRFEGAAIEWLA